MKPDIYQSLRTAIAEETPLSLATVIAAIGLEIIQPGVKMIIFSDAKTQGSLGDDKLDEKVIKDALELLSGEKSRTLSYDLEPNIKIEVYIESIFPPSPFVIIGADPDAVPIVNLAKQQGFKVVLVDHRESFANPEKYPDADEIIVCEPSEMPGNINLDEKTFVLVKTHNYLRDKEILKFVLKSNARYVGQLGPKARLEDLLKDLAKEEVNFNEEDLQKLYAPVGLDIGAESPEQIALSILSEMLAVKHGREGRFLKDQTLAIHPRDM